MTLPTLKRHIEPIDFYDAMHTMGIEPARALSDPVYAMRMIATVELESAERFMRLVMVQGTAPALAVLASEEQARLYVAGVMALVLERVRAARQMARRSALQERAEPSVTT